MTRDCRDTLTADLFDDYTVARSVLSCAGISMGMLLEVAYSSISTVESRWRASRPRFTDFPLTKFGPLTDDEKDTIEDLAEMGLKPWSIARRLQRHPSTVTWFMSTIGLKRLGDTRKSPFTRAGRQVRPFTEEEDAFAVECSCSGDPPATIARKMEARFGYARSRDTVACRLMMLASDEAAREAA